MAKNYVQEGDVLDYTTGTDPVASGLMVTMGKRVGIALGDIPAHSTGSVAVTGVWNVAKVPTEVVAQGDELYWDSGDFRLTKTADAAHELAGYAAAPAGNGDATVRIKINA
ncbi:DUF2190 family protein [Massilia oculi]|uniref:Recombinase RecA n=1 Tax=Massilia oculi TaxID=945844 RepID=A0A2S2DFZ0_9BURK|nr:DUF2190 family protein [Massilia oculi]AWL04293.1 recombinase RecA [Massilia oculi]